MKCLHRKMIAIDKLFCKYLILDEKFNMFLITGSAFLLGVCLKTNTMLTLSICSLCLLGMAITLYKSIKLADRQKKLLEKTLDEYEKLIKKYKSNNNFYQ